ncbi:hypothetical protein [Streptomyces sp. NPDC016626]|uniref:hypothetical protein n=1 Tax=Streptomyces sp. NPDC016626 TaxID=3364968 RepID=UPI0037012191
MNSRIPEVLEALVQLGTTDPDIKGVVVTDGPEATESAAQDWLIVGYDGDPSGDFEAAQSAAEYTGLGGRQEEQFQIIVAAVANRGDTDVAAARQRAYEIGGQVVAWLQADPSLGLRELEAGIGSIRLVQEPTEQGASVRLLLIVVGRAFI